MDVKAVICMDLCKGVYDLMGQNKIRLNKYFLRVAATWQGVATVFLSSEFLCFDWLILQLIQLEARQ